MRHSGEVVPWNSWVEIGLVQQSAGVAQETIAVICNRDAKVIIMASPPFHYRKAGATSFSQKKSGCHQEVMFCSD